MDGKGAVMSKFWFALLVAIVVIVGGFFVTSLSMASIHEQSLVDEWKSWIPAQEETVDNAEDTNLETEETLTINM